MPTSETTTTLLQDSEVLSALPVEHLCDFDIRFEPVQRIDTAAGTRLNYIIREGIVRGPRIQGEFLPGGGDWLITGTDGVSHLDVRATLRTKDDALIYLTNRGRVSMSTSMRRRYLMGQQLPYSAMYARSHPQFETDAPEYAFLNAAVCIAFNEVSLDRVIYRIYIVQ